MWKNSMQKSQKMIFLSIIYSLYHGIVAQSAQRIQRYEGIGKTGTAQLLAESEQPRSKLPGPRPSLANYSVCGASPEESSLRVIQLPDKCVKIIIAYAAHTTVQWLPFTHTVDRSYQFHADAVSRGNMQDFIILEKG